MSLLIFQVNGKRPLVGPYRRDIPRSKTEAISGGPLRAEHPEVENELEWLNLLMYPAEQK